MPTRDSAAPPRRVAVVLPARNEERHLFKVLAELPRSLDGLPVRAVVVDDGSTDGTARVSRNAGAFVVSHAINLGKGAALRTGCEAALRMDCDVIVLMDSDGQHRPADLPAMIAPIVAGEADLVLARRRLGGEMPAMMRLGNWGLSSLFTLLFGAAFSDTQCGFRAFTSDAYRKLRWVADDYSVESEMLVRAARTQLGTREVEIETIYHDAYKGTTVGDGVRIAGQMIRWRIGA